MSETPAKREISKDNGHTPTMASQQGITHPNMPYPYFKTLSKSKEPTSPSQSVSQFSQPHLSIDFQQTVLDKLNYFIKQNINYPL